MHHFKKIFLIALLPLIFCIAVMAQKPIYGFAYSTNLKDSIVYLTAVQQIPEAQLGKNDFLNYRSDYGAQFSHYIQDFYDIPQVMTIMYFDKNRAKVEKRYLKVRKTAQQEQRKRIIEIGYSDFKFSPIE